jgi:chromosome segregation ATPase
MNSLQSENDELRETLARKTQLNESLRSDLHTLQSKFDNLTIAKTNLEARLEQSVQETTTIRDQISAAPQSDPVALQGEIMRLSKALESKTKDFEYLAAKYQDASAAAAELAAKELELKNEVEELKRRIEVDVRTIGWESEKKAMLQKLKELEERCKLLEERERRAQQKGDHGKSSV